MPYFIYALRAVGPLEPLAVFEVYAEASARAKALRADADPAVRIRIMHAADAPAAEALLLQVREPRPAGEE